MSEKKPVRAWLVIALVLILVIPGTWFVMKRMEGQVPEFKIQPELSFLGESQTLNVTVSDPQSGLKSVRIGLKKDGKEEWLYVKTFPAKGFGLAGTVKTESIEVLVEPDVLGFQDGEATLRLEAYDHSWRGWGQGNKQALEKTVLVDTQAPDVDVLTRMHYISQGGAGLVIYKISESCEVTGVMAGDHFYPGHSGYFEDPDIYMAFFAVAYDQAPSTKLFVQSTDFAGNTGRTGFPNGILAKRFKKDTIPLSDSFLNWKMPEFDIEEASGSSAMTPVEKYLRVNRDLRQANERMLTDLGKKTENVLYWDFKPFVRFPRSARRASFADTRIYKYDGKKIDEQVHLGVDLASVAHADIPAGNTGKVIFADTIGIYGKTVAIDHGFGLISQYSHLSHIKIKEGDMVSRGEIIGKTGTTGMAAGDHLHYSMMIHDTFVNPDEWWDANWIKNNVTAKVKSVKSLWDK